MQKKSEKYVLFTLDILSIAIAYTLYFYFRVKSGMLEIDVKPEFLAPLVATTVYWVIIFTFFGLYRLWHVRSRVDEFIAIFKAVSLGSLLLFFVIFLDDQRYGTNQPTRLLIIIYWSMLLVFVSGARLSFRSIKRGLFESGLGLEHAIIVGVNSKAVQLFENVKKYPALGYKVVGFVRLNDSQNDVEDQSLNVLGSTEELAAIIAANDIDDVLIAFESSEHDKLLDVISHIENSRVSIKILPDMYDIISGQARTSQIYGFPLIEIMPHIMQPWEESAKRVMDIVISILILITTAPLWFIIGIAIKINSPGPLVYSQERVGKDGKVFRMHKFRSMKQDAESKTGPVWATENDPRITSVGWFLRKTRLDEIPQFFDVLRGDMSLVGPRPERPAFVEKLAKEVPLYKRRLIVKPGITGWAQIKQGYDTSIEDVKSKVRYDIFYIENMSFRMDLKILIMTVYVMIAGKGN
ncbi:MAG: undecaprenyl-phosphate glucose phosphotransferase [Bacteroidetes bacterium]|nr:undecaprenyl-phosphate glucose phosphotransferase [Bacteroidota bacterium]